MIDRRCSDVVRLGGDLGLAPEDAQESLATHLGGCTGCASYVSQITMMRELLGRHPGRDHLQREPTVGAAPAADESAPTDIDSLRSTLLRRAQMLDPRDAEDIVQRTLEVGVALQRRDHRARGIAELTAVMHTLNDAQMRLEGRATPAVDATAGDRARADSLDDLDSDADEAELFYPDLYPGEDGIDGWGDRPNQWRGGAQILGPEEVEETGEVYGIIDRALGELPEPLGELLALIDLQGYALTGSAQVLGLDTRSATAALARARNHVRGRLSEYLTGSESNAQRASR